MLSETCSQNTDMNRLLRWVLAFALVFAALHVASHDIDMGGQGQVDDDTCQICRINHVPLASLPLPSLLVPLQLSTYVKPDVVSQFLQTSPHRVHGARAPPLF